MVFLSGLDAVCWRILQLKMKHRNPTGRSRARRVALLATGGTRRHTTTARYLIGQRQCISQSVASHALSDLFLESGESAR